jgi:hypothetical protein
MIRSDPTFINKLLLPVNLIGTCSESSRFLQLYMYTAEWRPDAF